MASERRFTVMLMSNLDARFDPLDPVVWSGVVVGPDGGVEFHSGAQDSRRAAWRLVKGWLADARLLPADAA